MQSGFGSWHKGKTKDKACCTQVIDGTTSDGSKQGTQADVEGASLRVTSKE